MMVERVVAPQSGGAPSPAQRWLVQAAVFNGPGALAAWEAWQRAATITELEPDSQWLIPALYINLRRQGVAEARLGRYAHVYRHNWYKNHLLLGAARPVLAALSAAGFAPVVLGGAALAIMQYPALGARPIEALVVGGVCLDGDALLALMPRWRLLNVTPSGVGWELADQLDRRCQMRARLISVEQDEHLRARLQAVSIAGQDLRVLGGVDQLIHVLVERAVWDGRSAFLWVVDAMYCLRQLGLAGWAEIEPRARALGYWAAVREGLACLADDFGLAALMGN